MSGVKNSNLICQSGCFSAKACQSFLKAAFCSALGLFGDWSGLARKVRTFGASALPTRSAVTSSSALATAIRPASTLDARSAVRNGFLRLTSLSLFGALLSADRFGPRNQTPRADRCTGSSVRRRTCRSGSMRRPRAFCNVTVNAGRAAIVVHDPAAQRHCLPGEPVRRLPDAPSVPVMPRAAALSHGKAIFVAATLATACVVAVVVAAPLLVYSLTLATFGAAHVLSELRYVDRRFGRGLGIPRVVFMGLMLAGAVAARSGGVFGFIDAIDAVVIELSFVVALALSAAAENGRGGFSRSGLRRQSASRRWRRLSTPRSRSRSSTTSRRSPSSMRSSRRARGAARWRWHSLPSSDCRSSSRPDCRARFSRRPASPSPRSTRSVPGRSAAPPHLCADTADRGCLGGRPLQRVGRRPMRALRGGDRRPPGRCLPPAIRARAA